MASIGFTHPLIGTFLLNKSGEKILVDMDLPRESEIFKAMEDPIAKGEFYYYYYNNILMIPDTVTARDEVNPVTECQIEGMKEIWVNFSKWVLLLKIMKESNDINIFVQSLNLPDKKEIKNKLRFRNRTDFFVYNSNKESPEIRSKYSVVERLK